VPSLADSTGNNEFAGWRPQLERAERREKVQELRNEGMSQRAIASGLGISHMTVKRDVTNVTPHHQTVTEPIQSVTGTETKKEPRS
jgi:DNA invertase Pin-like site-specific DNA recombinase